MLSQGVSQGSPLVACRASHCRAQKIPLFILLFLQTFLVVSVIICALQSITFNVVEVKMIECTCIECDSGSRYMGSYMSVCVSL